MIGKFVSAANGSEIIVSLLPHSFCWKEGEKVLVYDGEGRLFSFYQGDALYRRGLDSRVLRIHRKNVPGTSLKAHRYLSPKLTRLLFQQAFRETQHLRRKLTLEDLAAAGEEVRDQVLEAVENVLSYSPGRLLNEQYRFARVYDRVSVLPPDQYMALVVQITHGCSYNRCTFCNLYAGRRFSIKSVAEVQAHLRDIKDFWGKALPMRKGIFLGGGNALSIATRRLIPLLRLIRQELVETELMSHGIYGFADVGGILRKSMPDLEALRAEGIRRIYLGLESGNEALLALVEKPCTPPEQLSAVEKIKAAGLSVGVIFLAGLGGKDCAAHHVSDTIDLINKLRLGSDDLVYLSRFYPIRGTPYWQDANILEIEHLDLPQIEEQIAEIRAGISPEILSKTKVSVYDIGGFIY